jgi:hypothetical protein
MRLIPTYCETCERCALASADAIVDSGVRCADCAGLARPLPGESYRPQDATLFKDLEASLHEARLTPLQAGQLSAELEWRSSHPGRGLKRIAKLLPSLSILELIVGNDLTTMSKAEGMLVTLLEASATRRSSGSGPMPVLGAVAHAKAGGG